jgi:hypothetical protein
MSSGNSANRGPAVRKSPDHKMTRVTGAILFGAPVWLLLGLFPARADTYPVNGVWAAPSSEFPVAKDEICFTIKTFGVEAVSRKSISEMIIFTTGKRFDVKGDVEAERTLESVKTADGGFWITEVLKRRRLGFRQRATYFLAIIDRMTIEIRDNSRLTRFVRCGPSRSPI